MNPSLSEDEQPARSSFRALVLLTCVLAVVVVIGALALRGAGPIVSTALPIGLVACGFAASELLVVDIPSRRDRHTASLSELPLVLALFFLSPVATIAAQTIGTAAALAGPMRLRGLKLAFNLAQVATQSLIAIVVFPCCSEAHTRSSRGHGLRPWSPRWLPIWVPVCSSSSRCG